MVDQVISLAYFSGQARAIGGHLQMWAQTNKPQTVVGWLGVTAAAGIASAVTGFSLVLALILTFCALAALLGTAFVIGLFLGFWLCVSAWMALSFSVLASTLAACLFAAQLGLGLLRTASTWYRASWPKTVAAVSDASNGLLTEEPAAMSPQLSASVNMEAVPGPSPRQTRDDEQTRDDTGYGLLYGTGFRSRGASDPPPRPASPPATAVSPPLPSPSPSTSSSSLSLSSPSSLENLQQLPPVPLPPPPPQSNQQLLQQGQRRQHALVVASPPPRRVQQPRSPGRQGSERWVSSLRNVQPGFSGLTSE